MTVRTPKALLANSSSTEIYSSIQQASVEHLRTRHSFVSWQYNVEQGSHGLQSVYKLMETDN